MRKGVKPIYFVFKMMEMDKMKKKIPNTSIVRLQEEIIKICVVQKVSFLNKNKTIEGYTQKIDKISLLNGYINYIILTNFIF